LVGPLARALAAMGADAIGTPVGRALPLSPDGLANPSALGRLLQAAGGPDALHAPLASVTPTATEAPSSNCRNSVFEVGWSDGTAPRTLFIKQPSPDFATRLFANVIGFWKIECAFCRNLAAQTPIEIPRIHAVVEQRSRFVLVMENLLERPDTQLFVNRNLLDGCDPERATRCLSTLARLHAGFTGWNAEERERGLPLDLHPFLSPARKPGIQAINRLAIAPCRRRAPDVFDAELEDIYRRALRHWETIAASWYREPLTLVHGDSHLGNFFETGSQMGMIDFQGTHWSKGPRDVAYFLINSIRPEVLAEREQEMVACYADEVTRLGSPLTPDEAWEQYRAFSFQTLMTAVVSLGLGSFTDSDAVMRAMLERSAAAVRRLEFGSWLDARIEEATGI
jgi:hypothetical protein